MKFWGFIWLALFACILNLCYLLFVYVPDMSKVLLVSDPHAMGWLPPNYWGEKVRTMGRSEERLAALIWPSTEKFETKETGSGDGSPPLRLGGFDGLLGSTAQGAAPDDAWASSGRPVKHYHQCGL